MVEKTEAQKRAQQKYMEKYTVAQVRMNRSKYASVQTAAASANESVSAYINGAIDIRMGTGGTPEAAEPPEAYLTLDTITAASEAAEAAGETIAEFVARAVKETAERDAEPDEVKFAKAVDAIAAYCDMSVWDVLEEVGKLKEEAVSQ